MKIVWHRVERALAFLDSWLVILPDGSIKTKVLKEETHTTQYLDLSSHHPLEHKRGEVHTLLQQGEAIKSQPKD